MKVHIAILILFVVSGVSCSTESTSPEIYDPINTEVVQADTVKKTNEIKSEDYVNVYEVKDEQDGIYKKNYPDGSLQLKGMLSNGKRVGKWESFHPNGNKQSENNYENGVLDGKTYTTYPNGQIMYIGYFANGQYNGEWLYYDQEGNFLKKTLYKNGKVLKEELQTKDSLNDE